MIKQQQYDGYSNYTMLIMADIMMEMVEHDDNR